MSGSHENRRLGAGALVRICAGVIVWASAFVALYAGYSLGCRALPVTADAGLANPVTIMLSAIALGHGAVLLILLRRRFTQPVTALPDESEGTLGFRHKVEGVILWLSLTALAVIAFPILLVTPCNA
jgi:hypothetical protein